ncbi:hypothetical protein [Pigmentibacter ruber]|uniref:hypothetical protein n=1 Tax=Pigmentibacter ruber TaxID=2683196 RepID=UPI00131BF8EB|nr:hypothetical protein [Pigmentibacter ruber]
MNRKQYFKIYILVFIALYSEFNLANQEMFVNIPSEKNYEDETNNVIVKQNQCKTIENGISGRIILPNSENIENELEGIEIRILGIDYSKLENKERYIYKPEKNNGCFNIENIPIGSSILLAIWDTNSKYYTKTVNAYAGASPNLYEIPLILATKVSLESSYASGTPQFYNKAGICGKAKGLSPGDLLGTTIFIENVNKKIFKASYAKELNISSPNLQELSMNGYFCVFNIDSCNKDEENCLDNPNYNLYFTLKNGERKRFSLIIPAATFSDENYFDLTAGVIKPVELYSLNDLNGYSWLYEKDNAKVSIFNKMILEKEELNKLTYFSTGYKFDIINYSLLDQNNFNQFFIIKPKEEFFIQDRSKNDNDEGLVFIEEKNPLKLKIFNPKHMKISDNTIEYLGSKKFGSIFFSLSLEKYNVDNSFVKIEVRNIFGSIIAESSVIGKKNNNIEIIESNNLELNGIVHSLEPGFYQFFLKSKDSNDREIFFTTFIQSFSGRTQIITEPFEQLNIAENLQEQNSYVLNYPNLNDIIPKGPQGNEYYDSLFDDSKISNNSAEIEKEKEEQNDWRRDIYKQLPDKVFCSSEELLNRKRKQDNVLISMRTIEIDRNKYYE